MSETTGCGNIVVKHRLLTYTIHPDSIPDALKERPQWVNFWLKQKQTKQGKKLDKVPAIPGERKAAETDDPTTWRTYEQALSGLGTTAGIGYVFSVQDGQDTFTGVDLDMCRDPESGVVAAWAQRIIDRLDSYAEVSPSGKGVHIIVKGKALHSGKRGNVEVYDHGRFFTVTGNHLDGTPTTIEDRQNALCDLHAQVFGQGGADERRPPGASSTPSDDLSDDALLERARSARNGAKFRALWDGADSYHVGDTSRADLALCEMLSFWTDKDPARIDLLFRQSGRMRPKWDERHSSDGRTYGQMTVAEAIAHTGETYTARRSRKRSAPASPPATDDGGGLVDLLAGEILREQRFARDVGGRLHVYRDGAYHSGGEETIRRHVKRLLAAWKLTSLWTSHRAEEVVRYIGVDAPELWESPPADEINLRNGILDLRSRKLRPHSPDFLTMVQLPVEYNPQATCPAIEAFVGETFPDDAHDLAWEFAAWLMRPRMLQKKAGLCIGSGDNGKSVYLALLTAFLGKRNVAGLSLQKLEEDRFAAARLVGKLANVYADLPSTHLESTSTFKAITGGDRIAAERKYADSFEFEPFARLVFSANHYPRSADSSPAFFDRWVVVPFERVFEGTAQIPREELEARLTAPSELSGLLNKALGVLPRLRQQGFSEPASVRRAREEFQTTTDPLTLWLDGNVVEDPRAIVAKGRLLASYNAECDHNGRPTLSATAFGTALRRRWPSLADGQRTIAGRLTWVWLGIGLRGDEGAPATPGRERRWRSSRSSRGSTIVTHFGYVEDEGVGDDGEGESEATDRENSVNPVNCVNGTTAGGCSRCGRPIFAYAERIPYCADHIPTDVAWTPVGEAEAAYG